MQIHKTIYELFVLTENKEYSRYKNLFLHSLEKITDEIAKYRHKVNHPTSSKKIPSPSVIVESIIFQSEVLIQSLKNSYQEEDRHELTYLQPLLCSETAEAVTLYTIEEAICMYHLSVLKDLYQSSVADQC